VESAGRKDSINLRLNSSGNAGIFSSCSRRPLGGAAHSVLSDIRVALRAFSLWECTQGECAPRMPGSNVRQNSEQFIITRPRQISLRQITLHFSCTASVPHTGHTTFDEAFSRVTASPGCPMILWAVKSTRSDAALVSFAIKTPRF
jgi:hypothetical protein